MMLKLFGGGLLLAAALALMDRLSRAARAEVDRLAAYLDLIRHIRGEIAAFCRPPGEILRRADPVMLAACGLGLPGERTLTAMLDGASLDLPSDGERIVRDFARTLGGVELGEQLALCDRASAELDACLSAARRRLPERLRLIRCTCLCGVGAIILLFL